MSRYSALLDEVMDAIVSGNAGAASALLKDKRDFPAEVQLGAYVEGYRLRLAEAVESAYPALLDTLGKAEFARLCREFIEAHPSRHFNLDKYPIAFGPYVAGRCKDGFAADLAVLESAIHDVYQREETPAISADWAQAQTMETLASTPLLPRAASALLEFETPVNDYLTSFRAGDKPAKPSREKGWLLVMRHKHQVHRLALEEGEYAMLLLLAKGKTLAEALEEESLASYILREDFGASLQKWLGRWVREGVLRQP